MKLLLDENLSRRLVGRIEDLFPGSRHVTSEGLAQAPDSEIWNYARIHDFAIISADIDFYEFAIKLGFPPKVIWMKGCDYPTATAESLIRSDAIRITEFEKDPEKAVLVLQPH